MEFTREMLKDQLHLHKKFQKIKKIIAFIAAYPKSLNSIYGTHRPLGVKFRHGFLEASLMKIFK
jgi:hypothetical protein